jgi:N-methylhydantoinase A
VQSVNLRVVGTVAVPETAPIDLRAALMPSETVRHQRDVYFGEEFGTVATPILRRVDLDSSPRSGPAIIEEYDTTCVVPPDWTACLDGDGNIILTRGENEQ